MDRRVRTFAVEAAIELARLTGATLQVVNAHKVAATYQLGATPEVSLPVHVIDASNEAIHSEAQRICDQAVARADRVGVHAEAHCVAGNAATRF